MLETLLVMMFVVLLLLALIPIVTAISGRRVLTDRIDELERKVLRLQLRIADITSTADTRQTTAPSAGKAVDSSPVTATTETMPTVPDMPAVMMAPATVAEKTTDATPPSTTTATTEQSPARATARPAPTKRPTGRSHQSELREKERRPEGHKRTNQEWEELFGGRILNRIGAIALVIGIGFFLKYAFDHNWITEEMRVLIGAASGILLLLGGMRTHRRNLPVFAQGLLGAGIATLYLTVYASFNFYHLVSQPIAFGLMSLVTAVAFHQAMRYDSLAVALLGWAGGFITPLLLSTGQANAVGLFSYLTLLDIGVVALLFRKRSWNLLEPLTVVATYLWYLAWYFEYGSAAQFTEAVVFISIFWALFHAIDIYRAIREQQPGIAMGDILALFSGVVYTGVLVDAFDTAYAGSWPAAAVLALGIVYAATAAATVGRGRSTYVWKRLTVSAVILAALSAPMEYEGFTTAILWSGAALGLIWMGTQWDARHFRTTGGLLFCASIMALLADPNVIQTTDFVAGSTYDATAIALHRAAAFATLTVVAALTAARLRPIDDGVTGLFRPIASYAAALLPLALLTIQIHEEFAGVAPGGAEIDSDNVLYNEVLTIALAWLLYSLPAVWLGLRKNMGPLIRFGVIALLLAVLMGSIRGIIPDPLMDFALLLNYRALTMAALTAGLLGHAVMIARSDLSWGRDFAALARVAAIFLLLGLLSIEAIEYFERQIAATGLMLTSAPNATDSLVASLRNAQQLTLSGLWVAYSGLLMIVGFWRKTRSLRIIAFFLFGASIIKIFLYDLSFLDTLYRIFSFIGLGMILLLTSYIYQRYKNVIFGSEEEISEKSEAAE